MPTRLCPVPEAQDRLTAAVLRSISAVHALETDPHAHADADCEYAAEQVALAARALVDAVDRLEPYQQPLGWPQVPDPAPQPGTTGPPPTRSPPDRQKVIREDVIAVCPARPR
jgi:hypothetical protein